MKRALLAVACLGLSALAAAQTTVHRCVVNGQTVYTHEPCRGGRPVATDDARTDEQRQAAMQAHAKEQARLQNAERERQAITMRAAKLQAAGIPYREAQEAARNTAHYEAKLQAAKRSAAKGSTTQRPESKRQKQRRAERAAVQG
jgi:hypothetical protein